MDLLLLRNDPPLPVPNLLVSAKDRDAWSTFYLLAAPIFQENEHLNGCQGAIAPQNVVHKLGIGIEI